MPTSSRLRKLDDWQLFILDVFHSLVVVQSYNGARLEYSNVKDVVRWKGQKPKHFVKEIYEVFNYLINEDYKEKLKAEDIERLF